MNRFLIRTPQKNLRFLFPSHLLLIKIYKIPTHSIIADEANEAVKKITTESASRKIKPYNKTSDDIKLKIGQYAAENGTRKAMRKLFSRVTFFRGI